VKKVEARVKQARCILSISAALFGLAFAPTVVAQAPDPRIAAAQAQFDTLAEAERKAIQADLIWTGDFEGAGAGGFGPMTFRAINAFKARVTRGEANGVLTAQERKLLQDAAKGARERAGFEIVTDARSGVRIGIPQKLMVKRDVNPSGGSRWQDAAQKITLDTRAPPRGDTLQQLFDKATSANVAGRRITYKLLRPDFYVISGETATGKFYSRLASGAEGLRGFSIGYDKALAAQVDPLVIAIANSFEPFPGVAPVQPALAARPSVSTAPVVAEPQALRGRFGVGFVVGNGLVLTARAATDGCRTIKAGDRPAQVKVSDAASGLAVLTVAGVSGAAPALAATDAAPGDDATLMAFGEGAARAPVALPGRIMGVGVKLLIAAPLQPGGAGAVAFDKAGNLLGVAVSEPSARYLVAGVAPARSHEFAGRAVLEAALKLAGVTLAATQPGPASLTTGVIAGLAQSRLVSIACEN
jgi:hypothetical protein